MYYWLTFFFEVCLYDLLKILSQHGDLRGHGDWGAWGLLMRWPWEIESPRLHRLEWSIGKRITALANHAWFTGPILLPVGNYLEQRCEYSQRLPGAGLPLAHVFSRCTLQGSFRPGIPWVQCYCYISGFVTAVLFSPFSCLYFLIVLDSSITQFSNKWNWW